MSRTCTHCHKPLKGRQARFCSDRCRSDYWNAARKAGENPVQSNQGPEVQSLLNDLFRVLRDHSDTISRLGKKEPD